MGEEERKYDEAAAAYRFQKMSCTKILSQTKGRFGIWNSLIVSESQRILTAGATPIPTFLL